MTNITVYDPAMCCSTGICGAEVDQRLVTFAADLDWLKSQGIAVTRINLSQEPEKFAASDTVKGILETSGIEGLPVVIVDDAMRSTGRYPAREELSGFAGVEYMAPIKSSGGGCCGGDKNAAETSSECC